VAGFQKECKHYIKLNNVVGIISHPEALVQNFFQVADIIFQLGRNKITLRVRKGVLDRFAPIHYRSYLIYGDEFLTF
jgi:hypothetical protein